MDESPGPKASRYPYALTGGAFLLVAALAAGFGIWQPFAALHIQGGIGEEATLTYSTSSFAVTDTQGSEEETLRYRDDRFDDGVGIGELRFGMWALPLGGFVALIAGITLFAAPSGGLGAARAGGIMGLLAAGVLIAAVTAFFLGFSDQGHAWIESSGEDLRVTGSSLLPGTYGMGFAAILAIGGGILGFSDKAPPRRAASKLQE